MVYSNNLSSQGPDRDLGLVLSGGGANGLFTVTVLTQLFQDGKLSLDRLKIVSGVSVGSLIGSMLVQGSFDELASVFFKLTNKDVYLGKLSVWTLVKALALKQDYVLDIKPLKSLLDKYVDLDKAKASGIDFTVGVTDLQDGLYKSISIHEFNSNEDYKNAILASCIQPPLWKTQGFSYTKLAQGKPAYFTIYLGSDGGVTNVTPIKDALVEGVNKIIIVNASNNLPEFRPRFTLNNVFKILLRVLDLSIVSSFNKDIQQFLKYNELAKEEGLTSKRYYDHEIYQFTESTDSLDFETQALKDRRVKNAQLALSKQNQP